MKFSFQQSLLVAALASASLTAVAHPNSVGYTYDSRGVIARDNYGNCVRTAEWAKENAVKECDPALFPAPAAPAPAPVVAPAPAPVPVPAPVVVPAPAPAPKPVPVRVDLSADETFAFGKSELSDGGKATLDKFASDLRGVDYDKITVIGHTDRLGSKALNEKLSAARATAVKQHLVGQGVAADKIETMGKSSSEPVTKRGSCDKLKGAKLHDCLAPDRRVSIRVTGTRLK